ncbi:MAG: KTSC domain-containing protein [Arcticibacter sp.]
MPSSVIASYHYNPDTQTLKVVFVSGMIYEYLEVPESVIAEMKAFQSKGTFLNKRIKGSYTYRKVS